MFIVTSAIISLLGSTAALAPAVPEPDPKSMTRAEIRAFNAKLAKGHKYFIRCKRADTTGSLVQREVSCRTVEQWAGAEARGNQEARDIAERMSSKAASGN